MRYTRRARRILEDPDQEIVDPLAAIALSGVRHRLTFERPRLAPEAASADLPLWYLHGMHRNVLIESRVSR